jgi:dCTP deaminase
MFLSDRDIDSLIRRGRELRIDPFHEECLNPSGLDVHLDSKYRTFEGSITSLDTASITPNHTSLHEDETIVLAPGETILAATQEYIEIQPPLAIFVMPKSGLARIGLEVSTGVVDSGFNGVLTLVVRNGAPWSITLHAGMRIAQVSIQRGSTPLETYSGSYQNQTGPMESDYTIQVP